MNSGAPIRSGSGATHRPGTKLTASQVEALRHLYRLHSREGASKLLKASPFTLDKIVGGAGVTPAAAARIGAAIDALVSR